VEDLIPIFYIVWFVASLAIFFVLPAKRAVVATLVGGWVILPLASFPEQIRSDIFADSIICSAYLSSHWMTKGSVVALAALVGALLTDPMHVLRLRRQVFGWCDLPMLAWCLMPLASGMSSGVEIEQALANTAYQAVTWGVPYWLGRIYLSDLPGQREFARGVATAGVVYIPLCLIEIVAGPVIYSWIYGYHPFQTDGIERFVGFRPIVLTEHGNQLGMWMAGAALLAVWLWRSRSVGRIGGLAAGTAAVATVATSLLCQAVGPVALLALGLMLMATARRSPRSLGAIAVVLVVGGVMLGIAGLIAVGPGRGAVQSVVGGNVINEARNIARVKSLGSRLTLGEGQIGTLKESPLLGAGSWDWWKTDPMPPWSLAVLTQGAMGIAGTATLHLALLWPLVTFWRRCTPQYWLDTQVAPAAALAVLLALSLIDLWLNPTFSVVAMAAAGGLSGISLHLARELRGRS